MTKEGVRLRFWGTRGSVPTPGPTTVRYGGNTSCVELRGPDGEVVVFDAGTGLRELGIRLLQERGSEPMRVHLLLSHLHWDHIQGLPFFRPAFDRRNVLKIYGPGTAGRSLKDLLGLGMDDPFFPVDLDALPAQLAVHQLNSEPLTVGPFRVWSVPVFHPSPCVAYRVEGAGRTIVYATDTEDPFSGRSNPVIELARDADVLIHDAQYLAEDLKPGWGHSTVDAAVEVALAAGARHLVLYHHDPDRSDDALDSVARRAHALVARSGRSLEITVAHEGLELSV